jgi:hypothetical protein
VTRAGQVIAQGNAPLVHTLDEGDYNLTVAHPDYETAQERLRIRPGNVYVVILNMRQGQFTGYFRVVTNPPGAQVFVDNREEGSVGNTPYQNIIPTGRHRIWIEKAGYRGEEEEFEVNVGENVVVRVDLTRVDFGRIRVVANVRGAHVSIDGNRVGEVPYEGDVPAGEHRITVGSDGMKDWSEPIVVRNGQLTPIRVRLRPGVNRGGAWATAILSGVLLTGSLALGIMANHVESDLNRDRRMGLLASDDSRILRGKIFAIGMDVALGLGLMTAGLAVYYFLRDPTPDSEGTVLEPRDWALAPFVGPEGGGASLRWSF